MLGGVVIQGNYGNSDDNVGYHDVGKSYGLLDVIAVLCMTVGLMFFTLADSIVQPNFNLTGRHGSWIY